MITNTIMQTAQFSQGEKCGGFFLGKEIKINGPNPHKWGHFGPTSVVSELVSDNAGGGMFVKHEEKKCRGES
jgi:hypothetical protein